MLRKKTKKFQHLNINHKLQLWYYKHDHVATWLKLIHSKTIHSTGYFLHESSGG